LDASKHRAQEDDEFQFNDASQSDQECEKDNNNDHLEFLKSKEHRMSFTSSMMDSDWGGDSELLGKKFELIGVKIKRAFGFW